MARGITEHDVHTAADEIVARGERPTVERIRAHLGTGSPNTVTRWLETWWQGLGSRLQAQQALLAVPEAPEAVAALAGELWRLALESAEDHAQKKVAADRRALEDAQTALRAEREVFALEATALRTQVDAAVHAEQVASAQAVELERLVNRLEGQNAELAQQRNTALMRAADADAARQASDRRLQELQDAALAERETWASHARAVEDRAHAEVDRARQESKELKSLLAALEKDRAASQRSKLQVLEKANTDIAEANRLAEVQRARADALDEQLAKLRDLPAALEATLRHSTSMAKSRKSGTKKAPRRSGSPAKVAPGSA